MKIIGVYNIKGGVGKTATSVNLAWLSAQDGHRTLVWDLDPQGAASFYFRIKPKLQGGAKALLQGKGELDGFIKGTDFEGLDLLPADFSYRHMDLRLEETSRPVIQLERLLKPLSEDYDLIFLDCPPSISLVSENIFRAADLLLVPTIPTTLSVRTLHQIKAFLGDHRHHAKARLLPFFSMVDQRRKMHQEILAQLPQEFPELLQSFIPYASEVERMGEYRAPLGDYAPSSPLLRAYQALWQEVRDHL